MLNKELQLAMSRIKLLLLLATLSADLRGQQIAETSLMRPQPAGPKAYDADWVIPEGCKSPRYKHSQGEIKHVNSKLQIELQLSSNRFERGETVEGTALVRNVGADAVVIPWSSNSGLSKRPLGSVEHEYEEGWFDFELADSNKRDVPLESESVSMSLYSSPSVPGSILRIEPGQSIVVRLRLVIEEKRILSEWLPIETGKATIRAEWRQVRFTWRRNGCEANSGYFNHRYQEDQNAVDVDILR